MPCDLSPRNSQFSQEPNLFWNVAVDWQWQTTPPLLADKCDCCKDSESEETMKVLLGVNVFQKINILMPVKRI